jgi:hypothetical protein
LFRPDEQFARGEGKKSITEAAQSIACKRIAVQFGRRPVRLDVAVRRFEIAGPVDEARTSAVIIPSPGESVALPAGSGLLGTAVQAAIDSSSDQSVADRAIATFGQDYRRWLLRETS